MKLLRWLVIGMLTTSVLAVLAACGWWVTWPERTDRQFVELVASQKLGEASAMLAPEPFESRLNLKTGTDWWKNAWLEEGSRSLDDLFHGREGFAFGTIFFVVERGMVVRLLLHIDR